MDKATVLTHLKESGGGSTLLGGELPSIVINSNKYIPVVTNLNLSSVDHAIHIALSAEAKPIVVTGPEGSGKSTAVKKLVVDWAKGEELHRFSFVFLFQFRELNLLKDEISLETLLGRYNGPPVSIHQVLQKPQDVLLVMDGLDEYKHSLDPSVHPQCSDPYQEVPVSCLVASLLHGSLMRGAAFVVATRPTKSLELLDGTRVELLGFLKPQREAYFKSFFPDAAAANTALTHMERTVGFYDFSSSPRFCWTVCSVYKALIDSGGKLPETVSQLLVDVLVRLLQMTSLNQADNKELVLALGRVASKCSLECASFTKEEMESFGLQRFPSSVDAFMKERHELDSGGFVVSFHSKLMQEFLSAVSFFLDKSTHDSLEKMLVERKRSSRFLEFFLSGLSQPVQRGGLEALLGEFSSEQIQEFTRWLRSSSVVSLEGFEKKEHYRYFHLLHQAQSDSLVKEIITSSARTGMSYGCLSLQDCVAFNYVVTSLACLETLNLYRTPNLTEEMAEVLAPAMTFSHKIILSDCSLSVGSIPHLASALSRGITSELDLSRSRLTEEQMKSLCSGLRDCKLHKINLVGCELTEASCAALASTLTSNSSQLRALHISFNKIGDEGFTALSRALHNHHCNVQDIQTQSCNITAASMEVFSAALCSGHSRLREVNLTGNCVGDGGVEVLFKALQHPLCKLRSLNLFDSGLSGACCRHVKEALMSEHCVLSELDLSVNSLGQEGALLLCQALSHPSCPMEKLSLARCELTPPVFKELGSVLKGGKLKSLTVGLNKVGDGGVKHLLDALSHPNCLLEELDVEMTGVTDASVEDLCAALRASGTLKSLELRNNSLSDASVPALLEALQDSATMLEMNLKYNDFSEEVFEMLDECERIRY